MVVSSRAENPTTPSTVTAAADYDSRIYAKFNGYFRAQHRATVQCELYVSLHTTEVYEAPGP